MSRWILLLLLTCLGAFWSGGAHANVCVLREGDGFYCPDAESAAEESNHGTSANLNQAWCDANFTNTHWETFRSGPAIPVPWSPSYDMYQGHDGCAWRNQNGDLIGWGYEQYDIWYFPHGSYTPPFDPDRNRGPCPDGSCFGDPINPGTGNKYEKVTEFRGLGPNPLEFTWTYNSSPTPAAIVGRALGENRTHFYQRRIAVTGGGGAGSIAAVIRPEGNVIYFTAGTGGGWAAPTYADGGLGHLSLGGQFTGWEYRNTLEEIEAYDNNGVLQSITDMQGHKQTLAYDAGGRLASVRDDFGRQLVFDYDSDNRISTLHLPDGQQVGFAYDAAGNLSRVTHPGNTETNYLYNEQDKTSGTNLPHALTGEIDPNGDRYATTLYDSLGRATGSFLGTGVDRYDAVYSLSKDGTYNASAVISTPSGKTRTMALRPVNLNGGRVVPTSRSESCAGCTTTTKSFGYESAGRPESVKDAAGVVTEYKYDGYGHLTETTKAKGTPQQQFVWSGWQQSYTAMPERIERTGQVTEMSHNSRHQTLATTVTDTATNATRRTTRSYCEQPGVDQGSCPVVGLLLTVDGPRTDLADVTTYSYYTSDDLGCAVSATTCSHRKGDLKSVTNPLGQVTEYLAYDGAGRLLSSRDANGVVTDTEYSPQGWTVARKVRGSVANSEADDSITRMEYDGVGQLRKITQPDGSFVTIGYDAAHRANHVSDSLGNSIHYTLDNAGNAITEETRDPSGALKRSLSRVFNGLGQLQTSADAQFNPTDYTYDLAGNPDKVTDPLGRVTDNNYDPLGRLQQVVLNSTSTGTDKATTQFLYDTRNNLASVRDPKGLSTTFTYNGLNDLTQLSSPDAGVSTFTYDSAGNRKTRLDGRGITMTYTYDALNRVTSQAGPTLAQKVYFDYDVPQADCSAGETFGAGRIARIRDESGSTRYCYDRQGNVLRKVQSVTGGSTLTVGASYNSTNKLVALTYPSGAIVVYGRDGAGRIHDIGAVPKAGAAQVTLVSGTSYLPFGPLASVTFNNGRILTKAFDANYAPDAVSDSAASNPLNEDVTIDAAGRLTALSERTGVSTTVVRNYGYDGLDRLLSNKNGATVVEGFTYDPTGDRLSKTVAGTSTAYTYASTSHRLTTVGKDARTYDGSGNTTGIGAASKGTVLTYDDRGRLRDAKVANKLKASYRYNGKGERVLKTDAVTAANSRQFVYDEAGRLLGVYTLAGARIQEYVWLDETLVAILSDHDGSTYQYVETDHTGTPRAVIHPAKNTIVWRWNRTDSAFGEKPAVEDPDANAIAFSTNLRFPGQMYDAETGLNYNYNRDFESATGRYLQSDPAGLSGGQSTYAYVRNRPLEFVDPTGLIGWKGTIHYGAGSVSVPGRWWGKFISVVTWTRVMVDLESDCDVNNKKYKAAVAASYTSGPGLSVLPDIQALGNVTLEDGNPAAIVDNLAGTMSLKGSSGSLGKASGAITVGMATGSFNLTGLITGDIDFSQPGELLPWSGFAPTDCECQK